jgi:hypothetical protein
MLRNIIVQTQKVKPNYERFDLSKKVEPVKPSTPKNIISFSSETVFYKLGIAMKITTISKTSHREKLNKYQER